MFAGRSGTAGWRIFATSAAVFCLGLLAACATDRDEPTDAAPGTTTEAAPPVATGEPEISQSVYRVKADRCASPENSWTTGFAIDSETVVTVAHALISTRGVTVIDTDDNEHAVEVAYVDEEKDIALLRLIDTTAAAVPIAGREPSGDVWVVTFKQKDKQPVVQAASVLALMQVTMDGEGERDAIKLTADISVGDSGGPVVNSNGELLGMIFATTIDERTGWAIAEPEVSAAVGIKNANRPEVVPPACTTDPTEPDSGSGDSGSGDSGSGDSGSGDSG